MQKSLVLSIALALLSTVACAAPADDEDTGVEEESGEASSALLGGSKAAPSCVVKTVDDFSWGKGKHTVTIKNDCKQNLKLGLDLNLAPDPDCAVVAGHGGTVTWTFGKRVDVSKVKACK